MTHEQADQMRARIEAFHTYDRALNSLTEASEKFPATGLAIYPDGPNVKLFYASDASGPNKTHWREVCFQNQIPGLADRIVAAIQAVVAAEKQALVDQRAAL